MQTSEYFNLKLADGTDTVNPLTIDRPNYVTIDEVMHNNTISSVGVATELTDGTVHALTRVNPETPVFRFIATANAKPGDTYTVDGVQVTALLSNGTPLSDGSYVINANVLCALTGTMLTFFVSSSNSIAKDAEKLGGLYPEAYAKTDVVAGIATTATNASDMALANKNALSGFKFGTDADGNYGYYKVGADTVTPFKTMIELGTWNPHQGNFAVDISAYGNVLPEDVYVVCNMVQYNSGSGGQYLLPLKTISGNTLTVSNSGAWTPANSDFRIFLLV